MSCVRIECMSPRPIYGGPASSPTDRGKPKAGGASVIVGIRSGKPSGIGRVCWTNPPSAGRGLKVPRGAGDGEKSPKIVNAAVLPVLLMASRLSAGRPPVVGFPAVNRKLVGVERAALETFETWSTTT